MNVKEFVKEHFSRFWTIYAGFLGTLYLFYKTASPLGEALGAWISGHYTLKNGSAVLDNFGKNVFGYSGIVGIALLLVITYLSITLYQTTKEAQGAEKISILRKTFLKTTQAADLIAKKLFPGATNRVKVVRRCTQVHTIYSNGDCHVTEKLLVSAKDRDIHFMQKIIAAEPEADPVEFPDEIDLKIVPESKSGNDVRYLISKNEDRSKAVVIFFLPRIKAKEEDVRALTISYYWKGMMNRLVTKGEEPFSLSIKSVEPVRSVEIQFWIKPNEGKLTCRHVGVPLQPDQETLEESPSDDRGMSGWVYTATNVPVAHKIELRLELRKN